MALPISLPERGSRLLRDLHRQLRAAIINGRLRPGARLPSTRVLAASCGLSRNTAVAAYELLLSEGYVAARGGSGTRVAVLLFGYGAIEEDAIAEGLSRLRRALRLVNSRL